MERVHRVVVSMIVSYLVAPSISSTVHRINVVIPEEPIFVVTSVVTRRPRFVKIRDASAAHASQQFARPRNKTVPFPIEPTH